jgi:hypothetical protein
VAGTSVVPTVSAAQLSSVLADMLRAGAGQNGGTAGAALQPGGAGGAAAGAAPASSAGAAVLPCNAACTKAVACPSADAPMLELKQA